MDRALSAKAQKTTTSARLRVAGAPDDGRTRRSWSGGLALHGAVDPAGHASGSSQMEADVILKALNEVFAQVVDHSDTVLKRETTAKDVEEWDSLNHIQ